MIPTLQNMYTVEQVNGYYGRVLFTDTSGKFELVRNAYIFIFECDRTRCSNVNSKLHDALISRVTYPLVEEEKFKDNMFTRNDSPGRAIYEVEPDVDVKCEEDKVMIEQTEVLPSVQRSDLVVVPETTFTLSMAEAGSTVYK